MVVTKAAFERAAVVDPAETEATLAKLTGYSQGPAERGGPPKPGGKKDGRLAGNEGGKGKTLKKGRKTPPKK